MKKILVLLSAFVFSAALNAEPKKIDDVVDLLQKAKTSSHPLPLLEKAKKEFDEYHAAPGHAKEIASGMRARGVAGNDIAAHKRKKEAEKMLNEAIQVAKSGGDPKSKIEAAIAEIHNTAAL